MYLTGFADEVAPEINEQIKATKMLGWNNIETRKLDNGNLASISEEDFEALCEKLEVSGIHFNCYGSGIANWQRSISDPPETSYEEMKNALPRMQRLGIKLVRIMSFQCPEDESINTPEMEKEVIKRVATLVKMAEDGGVICVHENCNNWGGRSYEHTLRLLDAIQSPSFKLVFDTGNPVFRKDIRFGKKTPFPYQNALEFYNNVKDAVAYIHIKDGKVVDGKTKFTFAGEGDGCVREILSDLYSRGYDGGISIEPHLAVVAHDPSITSDADIRLQNYVEYGRRLEKMVREIGWDPQ